MAVLMNAAQATGMMLTYNKSINEPQKARRVISNVVPDNKRSDIAVCISAIAT